MKKIMKLIMHRLLLIIIVIVVTIIDLYSTIQS